jgi:hypothetical protein
MRTNVIPACFVTVGAVDKAVKANRNTMAGLSINRFVRAMGGDRKNKCTPAHASITPIYDMAGKRWVHKVYLTKAGLQALATGDYKAMPKPPYK